MVIVMSEQATEDQVEKVIAVLTQKGYDAHRSTGATRTVIGVVGASKSPLDPREFEIMPGVHEVDLVAEHADILQVGARNMQNFNLLKEIGKQRKAVMLKRGLSATIQEWLLSAEYIMAGGNRDVMLCERGIRTFENYTRNTMDISAIPVVKKLSHLPIVADPSHGTGRRDQVAAMARAAVAAGADGLMVEVHPDPDRALSDGAQSLRPDQFTELMRQLRMIAPAVGRTI